MNHKFITLSVILILKKSGSSPFDERVLSTVLGFATSRVKSDVTECVVYTPDSPRFSGRTKVTRGGG